MGATVVGNKIGNIVITHGTWTHTIGAAAFTVAIGGYVLGAIFQDCDADEMHSVEIPYSVSRDTTSGIDTVTVYPGAAVTTGKFMVFHSG